MPIQNPLAAITFPGYLGPKPDIKDWEGLLHPTYLKGGFQSVTTIAERNAIPIWSEGNVLTHAGFSESDDGGYTTGRRAIGMLVYVLENNKFYTLCPKGYFVNPVDENTPAGGETEWQALSEWVKAGLMKPNATSIYDNDPNAFPFQGALYTPPATDANDPWMELQFGGDGTYNSNLTPTLSMTEDVGGMPTGTLVSDLSGVQTYDQLFDTILFPTSYPTASGPTVGLSLSPVVPQGLKVIGETYTGSLVTTANQGSITLNGVNQGVRSGDVTAATIAGPGGPYTLGVSAPNGIDDQALQHVVTLGSNSWTLTGTFAQGPVPLDSTGQPYTAVQYNGGTKQNSTQFEGVYPYFLGTSAGEDQFTERALISFSSNNVECLQDYLEDSGDTGNPVLNHRILVPLARSAGAITIQVFNPNGSGAAAWPDNTSFWTEGPQVQRAVGSVFNQVDYRVFTKDGSSGGSNNYRLVF